MSKDTKSARRKASYKARGLCTQCGQRKPVPGGKMCEKCRKYYRDYRTKLREKGFCKCGRLPVDDGGYQCELCRERTRARNRELREKVFDAYGRVCACCGEDQYEFLQIDHTNNDGAAHRREIGGGAVIFHWLVKNGFPKGFQVLCANCNYAKAHYGCCPHRPDKEVNGAPRKKRRTSKTSR